MATAFPMPKLGLTMEAGTIIKWVVDEGAEVGVGEVLLRVETDKVETDIESSGAGRLHQVGAVGESYDCGAEIGWFLEPGEEPPAARTAPERDAPAVTNTPPATTAPAPVTVAPRTGGRLFVSPNARRVAARLGVDLASVLGTGPGGRIVSQDVELVVTRPQPPAQGTASSALATLAARSLADDIGIDVNTVAASGTDPRVTRADVLAHVRNLLAQQVPSTRTTGTPSPAPIQTPDHVVPLTGMRGTIARRMSESLNTMAQLTLMVDVDMDRVVADRTGRRGDDVVPGYTDYVVMAVAAALREHPHVNSQVSDEGVAYLPDVHVGLAVALDDGLVVPAVRHADQQSLVEIASDTTRLTTAAREGTLSLADMDGSTFSVTALGMFGVDGFTPVVNPPNTAILGVGRLRDDVAWADDGSPIKVSRLTLSLTWDHRAFDGAPAARFAQSIKANLESDKPFF